MDVDISGFNPVQQQALFDLLILAMYADGHLSTVKDERLEKLLIAMGHTTEHDRDREFDAAVTRTRPHVHPVVKARKRIIALAEEFKTRPHQRTVYAAVENMITTDSHVTALENNILTELRLRYRL
jgi:hypothetical protein